MPQTTAPVGLRDPRAWLALVAGALLAAVVVIGVRLLDEVVYEDAPGYGTSLWQIEEPQPDEGL